MHNILNKNILKKIKEYSLSNTKEELCGLIYISIFKKEVFIRECENISLDKRNKFLINPMDQKICEQKGDILACFHSHVKGGGFSSEDIDSSLKTEIPYIVYNVIENKFYFFDPIKYSYYKKYINLNYQNGVNDCWATLERHLVQELKIFITDPEPERSKKPDENPSWTWEYRKDWLQKNNFKKIHPQSIADLKVGDILIFKSQNELIPTSGAILLENKLILHQRDHQISKIESLRKAHFRMTSYVARFDNKQ
jgi:proteasome lid subunit RPN8/RPN11